MISPIDEKVLDFTLQIAEEYYGTTIDQGQIPINKNSFAKLHLYNPDTILYESDKDGKVLGWSVAFPTTTELMDKFLDKKITEKELFDQTDFSTQIDAIYLCSTFVLPENRHRGLAKQLLLEAIRRLSKTGKEKLFAWTYSQDGGYLIKSLEKYLSRKIRTRNN